MLRRPPPSMPVPDQPIRLSRLLMLGLLVAVLHGLVLSWLREQLPQFEPLASMAQPLFTRTLQPTAALPPSPSALARATAERPQGPLQAAMTLDATALAPASAASAASSASSTAADSATSEPAPPADKTGDITPNPTAAVEPPSPPRPAPPAEPADKLADVVVATSPPAAEKADAAPNASAPPPPTDTWPAATRLSYTVTGYYRGDLHGSARVQWQRDGIATAGPSRYQVQLDLYTLGITLFTMTSQGELGAQGLVPRVYEERRPGGVRRVWFESDTLRLDDGRKVPLPQQAQDTASQFVELGHRFSTGREVLQAGREVAIWLARPGGVDLWTYDVVGEENLRAGDLGTIAAFRLKPRPLANPRGNVMAEIWFAPSLQYLPVRVRISMGLEQGTETFVDLMVERIDQAAK